MLHYIFRNAHMGTVSAFMLFFIVCGALIGLLWTAAAAIAGAALGAVVGIIVVRIVAKLDPGG